jgi:hypothetical protein
VDGHPPPHPPAKLADVIVAAVREGANGRGAAVERARKAEGGEEVVVGGEAFDGCVEIWGGGGETMRDGVVDAAGEGGGVRRVIFLTANKQQEISRLKIPIIVISFRDF